MKPSTFINSSASGKVPCGSMPGVCAHSVRGQVHDGGALSCTYTRTRPAQSTTAQPHSGPDLNGAAAAIRTQQENALKSVAGVARSAPSGGTGLQAIDLPPDFHRESERTELLSLRRPPMRGIRSRASDGRRRTTNASDWTMPSLMSFRSPTSRRGSGVVRWRCRGLRTLDRSPEGSGHGRATTRLLSPGMLSTRALVSALISQMSTSRRSSPRYLRQDHGCGTAEA